MKFLSFLNELKSAVRNNSKKTEVSEIQQLMIGSLLCECFNSKKNVKNLSEVEFRVFSQWGDDGIIQWVVNNIDFPSKTFIEFGVENYRESNTRFLMMNNNWSGFIMDGSESAVKQIINSEYYWKYNLSARKEFVDAENINDLLLSSKLGKEIGILHIDIDGVDYWVWKAIEAVSPILVILEYNSVFGIERSITVPYKSTFSRSSEHYSNLYFGASLRALLQLSEKKGYAFIGCNSAGNNAYFIQKDKLNDVVREISLENGYVSSLFRESRSKDGRLTYLSGNDRLELIRGLPVFNTETELLESI